MIAAFITVPASSMRSVPIRNQTLEARKCLAIADSLYKSVMNELDEN